MLGILVCIPGIAGYCSDVLSFQVVEKAILLKWEQEYASSSQLQFGSKLRNELDVQNVYLLCKLEVIYSERI